ncbi:hypothetical protein B0H16DRAFT_1894869 [Mycena metata]|uniref:Uncharacterized protein n=1 Tax=Mycena metata TaxID=1033252 RepID=A0AAD7MPE7_9AGAR|nr:hypothetical protein B0H16DRAFT_1894869 [Mycena metata]
MAIATPSVPTTHTPSCPSHIFPVSGYSFYLLNLALTHCWRILSRSSQATEARAAVHMSPAEFTRAPQHLPAAQTALLAEQACPAKLANASLWHYQRRPAFIVNTRTWPSQQHLVKISCHQVPEPMRQVHSNLTPNQRAELKK